MTAFYPARIPLLLVPNLALLAAILTAFLQVPLAAAATPGAQVPARIELHDGWSLQTARKVRVPGDLVSTRAFVPSGWHRTAVPTTVLGAQVGAGQHKDLFRGMNLRRLPGMTYRIGLNSFANEPMRKDSPYAVGWWYRTEVKLPAEAAGQRLWLHLDGVNYRANLWANGKLVASDKEIQGPYKRHEFDVTSFLHPGEANILAVEVFAPTEKQLGINWVDWSPTPPDKNMGLWGATYLTTSGPVSVRHPQVVTHFANATLAEAELRVMAELTNATDAPVTGVVKAMIDQTTTVEQPVTLAAHESRRVLFNPDRFAGLRVKSPRIWWPAEMGTPALHDLEVRFFLGADISDQQRIRFGIREVTSEMTADGYRLFKVNGRRILIRGGGWMQDLLLRRNRANLEAQVQYVLDMHLNTIRMEGQFEPDEFLELADAKGLLIIAGWCCCDIWEKWDEWPAGTLEVAVGQLRAQILRMRSHPSLIAWMNGSDGPPPPAVEAAYAETLADAAWPNVVINSAADAKSPVTGPSGVKMTGPYDYVPPGYWFSDQRKRLTAKGLIDARFGGAFGFNTETGPGPAIPPLETLKKMLPKEQLWPLNQAWNFHAAGERFQTMSQFRGAMNATYGKPTNLTDFLRKSQAMAYDGQRAMFEAHGRNKYTSTGVIQWLINSSWPSTFWHLYDYYLYPAGGYFGTKKACEPLHVLYAPDDRGIFVVNSRQQAAKGLRVTARAYDLGLKELTTQNADVDSPADSSTRAATLPTFPANAGVTFVKLTLNDSAGQPISDNFYWLPATPSTIAWDKVKDTALAPIDKYEDLKALARLPRVKLTANATRQTRDGAEQVLVTLQNPSKGLAFQVHLGVRAAGSSDEVLPVLWQDNYLSLLPGEGRTVTANYVAGTNLGKAPTVVIDGWNIEPVIASIGSKQ